MNGAMQKSDYVFLGLWKEDLFPAYFWVRWYQEDLVQQLQLNFSESGTLAMTGGYFFIKKSVLSSIDQTVKEAIDTHTTDFFDEVVVTSECIFEEAIALAHELKDTEPTPERIHQITTMGRRILFSWCFGYMLSEVFDSYLLEQADKEGVSQLDIANLVPSFETGLFAQRKEMIALRSILEQKDLLQHIQKDIDMVVRAIQDDKILFEEIHKHIKTYEWIEVINFRDSRFSIERLLEQISDYEEGIQDEVPQYITSEYFSYLLTCASKISYNRQIAAERFSEYTALLIPFLYKTSELLGVSYKDMLNLVPEEIIEKLERPSINISERINKRAHNNWIVFEQPDGELVVIDDGEKVQEIASHFIETADKSSSLIKGQVGNKGIAQGRVKVIFNTDDFYKMEDGDVLVTTMTTPDFVVLMQKSSAIVTDIGGLLSHASIVSREMGKPCVIGTKVATQILKDGDMVEVDADEGIVRIIK